MLTPAGREGVQAAEDAYATQQGIVLDSLMRRDGAWEEELPIC